MSNYYSQCQTSKFSLPPLVTFDTWRFSMPFLDDSGEPWDLKDSSLFFILKETFDGDALHIITVDFDTYDDEAAGTYRIKVNPEDTGNIKPGKYFIECKRVYTEVTPKDIATVYMDIKTPSLTVLKGVDVSKL